MCAVLGPNGGGKTTLLRCLLGLQPYASGELRVLGQLPAAVRAQDVSYVPQQKTLDRSFPAQALEVVLSGLRRRWSWRIGGADVQLALEALRDAGAEKFAQRSISVLSGGELQRVFLARALVRRPQLILLDEPASGVDIAGEADFHQVLEAYRRNSGATVVMVTHDWAGAAHHADKVLVLAQRQLAFGPPHEALSDSVLRDAFGHHGHAHAMGWGQHV
ncbi:MAG: metal ABC transporter ATP-binding protein, partial [bacterium]|nr:metal ABC transporter ATP-binding protein [bacterium]